MRRVDIQVRDRLAVTVERTLELVAQSDGNQTAAVADRRPCVTGQIDVRGQFHGLALEFLSSVDRSGNPRQLRGGCHFVFSGGVRRNFLG